MAKELCMLDDFGTLRKTRIVYNDKGQTIPTYRFTKKQWHTEAIEIPSKILGVVFSLQD